jgi:hypothetical protein
MKKAYAIANTAVIIAVVVWNYYTTTTTINGNTVGSLSADYENLFTPAGYAFSIWGIIFLGLLAHGVFQLRRAFSAGEDHFIEQIGPWLLIANLANIAWVWFWLNEVTWLSVILMLIILFSLLTCIVRLDMARWDAPLYTIAFVWWPIALYSGWIAVATIANVSAYLAKLGWDGGPLSEQAWTVTLIVIAVAVNLFMIATRNLREFAFVGAWALAAIAVRHWGSMPTLQWTALIGALVLVVAGAAHGFRNRRTAPIAKWRRGELR